MESHEITGNEFTRLANNFYEGKGISVDPRRIALDSDLINYFAAHHQEMKDKKKIAFCWICLNPPYWEFAKNMVVGAKQFFLPGHNVDFFLWSDIPKEDKEIKAVVDSQKQNAPDFNAVEGLSSLTDLSKFIHENMTVFSTDGVEWPLPTLMRYHLFLQEEEALKDYDYIFYCDVDMMFVNVVGDELLGQGLTVAPHPGYYIRKELYSPYEPNKDSHSFIKRPGFVSNDEGKPRFMPYYAAGGLQGGTTKEWFKAMKVMKVLVDKDMAKGYIPIWNDETVWNKYLFDLLSEEELMKSVFLTPAYIYPDSLIKEYYEPIVWGRSFPPKLMTLTKKFSISKEGGDAVAKMTAIKPPL